MKKGKFSFFCYDLLCVKPLTLVRLQISHLKKHKFSYGFGHTVSPISACNVEIKDTEHLLLRCHSCSIQRFELFNNINKVDLFYTQLDTKEQANNLLSSYPSNKTNILIQGIIKFVINFL